MKASQIQELLEKGLAVEELNLTVDEYKTISEKSSICEEIVSQCIIECADGMKAIDFTKKYLAVQLALLVYFAHIELDMENAFDYLEKNKVIRYIENMLPDTEHAFIIETVEKMLDQEIQLHNSVPGVLNRNLSTLVHGINSRLPNEKKIKSIAKSVIREANKLDWSNAPILQQMFTAVSSAREKK